jgi:transposase InsO family protein
MYTSCVTIIAEEICQRFFGMVIVRHGCPQKVLTHQGRQFTSKAFKRICKQYSESSAHHHQTNGKVERFHKFLENLIATMTRLDQLDWSRLLDNCLFVYRTTLNRMLNETPFFLLHGRDAT